MNTETIIKVIQKCIDDTKENKLYWKLLSSNPTIENTKPVSFIDMTSKMSLTAPITVSNAYYAEYKEGFFFLKQTPKLMSFPQDNSISLYVQKNSESYSELIAVSYSANPAINILLRNLSIIVDTQISSFDNFIDDFLNSDS